jgi:GntR family transcriptional regulator
MTTRLRRESVTSGKAPLYYQLGELLTKDIQSGRYREGDLLPGDKQLAEIYGVSVITVRAAMRILIERGLVERFQGKGSFVTSKEQVHALWGLGSVDDLVMTGLHSSLVLLKRKLIVAPDWVKRSYSLSPGAKVYWLRTARIVKRERFFITDIYLPLRIGEKLSHLDFTDKGQRNKLTITLVEERCGVSVRSIFQTMTAELASADVARSLGLKAGQPLLVIERKYVSADGELVQVARSRYRVDHYRYTINLARLHRNVATTEKTVATAA